MLVKGILTENWNTFTQGTEVRVDVPEEELKAKGWYNTVPQEKIDSIKKEYLKELLEATINHVVCPEYLELFEDVDEWHTYKEDLLSNPDELFTAFAKGDIQDAVEDKAEEVYQNNKPEYFPVDVRITCNATIYVKARTESEVQDVMNGYELTADDILSDVGGGEYEIDNFWVGDPVDEDYIRYETVYDAKDYIY